MNYKKEVIGEDIVPVAQEDEHRPLDKERSIWKIEKIVKKGDYLYAVVKNHPNAIKYGYVLLHRVIIENHLGRLLNSDEVVHHKNFNKFDNSIDNLEVMCEQEHQKLHTKMMGRLWATIKCPNCGKLFEKEYNKLHFSNISKCFCCSKKCGACFQHKLCKELTVELEKAISENIVRIYRKFHDNSEQTDDNGMRRGHTPST